MDSYEEWRRTYEIELDLNKRSFAEQREQIRRDYAGQWVGFAFGRVIAADRDENRVLAAMEALNPQPETDAVFKAEDEPRFEVIEDYHIEILPE